MLGETADELARQSGFIQRQRKLSGASFAQTLVFGWLADPQSSMEGLSPTAANLHVAISRQGLDARFSPQAADCMEALLKAAVTTVVRSSWVDLPVLRRFTGVYLVDSTVIELPSALDKVWAGCGGYPAGRQSAALKISVNWELLAGNLRPVELQAERVHDQCPCSTAVE